VTRINHAGMNEHLIDILTRLENMIRIGTILDVDLSVSPPLCRVQTGELETDWRPWACQRAGSARTSWAPTTGEQVILFSPSGDLGTAIIWPALYSDANPAPDNHPTRHRTIYPDGAVTEYDPEAGALNATGIKTGHISASVSITLETPNTLLTGDLQVAGGASIGKSMSVNKTVSAGTGLSAPSASIGGINFGTHRHPGDSGGTTGVPI
jgi:phage baseplate assembly protein V